MLTIDDPRLRRIARISRLLRLVCLLGALFAGGLMLTFAVVLSGVDIDVGGTSWVLERFAENDDARISVGELRERSLTGWDLAYLVVVTVGRTLVPALCLLIGVRTFGEFTRARVFTRHNVRRLRTVAWVLLAAWFVDKVLDAAVWFTAASRAEASLRLELGVAWPTGGLWAIALVFLAAWILDIGRSLELDSRLTV